MLARVPILTFCIRYSVTLRDDVSEFPKVGVGCNHDEKPVEVSDFLTVSVVVRSCLEPKCLASTSIVRKARPLS